MVFVNRCSRTRRFLLASAAVIAAQLGCTRINPEELSAQHPGAPVVLISIDTLRADRLPIYGYRKGSTPVMDRLAREGIVFDDVYSHTPLTLPSHASLFTGLLPTRHGVRDNIGYTLTAKSGTLASRFKAAGYATGAAVSAYVLRHQTGIADGFDFFDDAIEVAGTGDSLADTQRDGRLTVDALGRLARSSGRLEGVRVSSPLRAAHAVFTAAGLSHAATPTMARLRMPTNSSGGCSIGSRRVDGSTAPSSRSCPTTAKGSAITASPSTGSCCTVKRCRCRGSCGCRAAAAPDGTSPVRSASWMSRRRCSIWPASTPAALDGQTVRSALATNARVDRSVYSETFYPRLHLGWSDLASATEQKFRYIRRPIPELYDLSNDPGERQNLAASRARNGERAGGMDRTDDGRREARGAGRRARGRPRAAEVAGIHRRRPARRCRRLRRRCPIRRIASRRSRR